MVQQKLTRRTIDAIKAAPKDFFVWYEDLSGFGIKVTPAGSKIYLIQYRMGGRGSSTRRYTIGKHDSPWNPAVARAEATLNQNVLLGTRDVAASVYFWVLPAERSYVQD